MARPRARLVVVEQRVAAGQQHQGGRVAVEGGRVVQPAARCAQLRAGAKRLRSGHIVDEYRASELLDRRRAGEFTVEAVVRAANGAEADDVERLAGRLGS